MSDSPLVTAAKSAQPKAKKAGPVKPAAAVVAEAPQEHKKENIPSLEQYLQKEQQLAPGEKVLLNPGESIPKIGDQYKGPVLMLGDEYRNILVDLGFQELVEFTGGYVPSRPELDLTPKCREAIKRLALTLEQRQERLSDGSEIRGSVPKTIVWLCEKFAEAVG